MTTVFKQYLGEIVYASSNVFTPAVTIIANVIAVAYIMPVDMGIYQSVLLVGTYASFLQLGVFNGLNRNIAFYKAQNRTDVVLSQVNAAHSVAVAVSSVGMLVGAATLGYALLAGKSHVYVLAASLLVLNLVITPHKTQIETTYRSGQDFKALGKIIYAENTFYFVASLLPILIGFLGKILSDAIRLVFGFWLRWKDCPIRAVERGTIASAVELAKTGFPLLLGGYLWSVFVVADQTFIALKLSMSDLGVYTLSRLTVMALMFIPAALNALLYPKAAALYGRTGSASALRPFWKKSLLLFSAIIVPVVAAAYILLPPVVERFMPKYSPGISSAMINLLTGITFISMGPSVIMGTLRRNRLFIAALVSVLLLFWGGCLLLPQHLVSLESVAGIKLFFSMVLSLFVILYTFYLTREHV